MKQHAPMPAHDRTLAIVGGGPSVADTIDHLRGDVAAVNGSHDWLLSNGIVPWACGFCDSRARVSKTVTPRHDVWYYVADTCHDDLLSKLDIVPDRIVRWKKAEMGWGCSMGLRWIFLGHDLGYRSFDLHGFDSSLRDGRTHAYPGFKDGATTGIITVDGYRTRANFLAQAIDFFDIMRWFDGAIDVRLFGDGLLQSRALTGPRSFPHDLQKVADRSRVDPVPTVHQPTTEMRPC